jgi:hypothetical protein
MDWSCLPLAALASGAILFAVGLGFHFLLPFLWPRLENEYHDQTIFRRWDGWTRVYMLAHPWVYGVVFAGVFLGGRAAFGGSQVSGICVGLVYGLAVFFVGSMPVFALNFASFRVSASVIAAWALQNLCQCSFAGIVLGWSVS